MHLLRRLQLLEKFRPPSVMPEVITIVRGRDDNPDIPDGFFPCDILFVSLDELGNRHEELCPCSPEEVS